MARGGSVATKRNGKLCSCIAAPPPITMFQISKIFTAMHIRDVQDCDCLRHDTPGTRSYHGEMCHFNNAGCSLPTSSTMDATLDHLRKEFLFGGYETFDQTRDTELARPYTALASLLECDPDEIAIMSSATDAWQQVVYGLAWNWKPGDKIYTSVSEYGSNYIAYLQIQKRSGVEIAIIPELPESGDFDLEAFEKLLLNEGSNNQVVLVSVNHVPTSSGKVYDVEALGVLTSKYGVRYMVDACQSVGQLPVNVKSIKCDFLSGTGRKYLRAPRGSGFLFCKRSSLQDFEPATLDNIGARWVSPTEYVVIHSARRFERYEMSFAAKVGLGVAVEECLRIGIDFIWKRIQLLAKLLRSQLSTIPGITITDKGKVLCGIVTFTMDAMDADDIQQHLFKQGINTSVSRIPSTRLEFERRGLTAVVRASVHVFNTEKEIQKFISAVKALHSCT